MTKGRPLIEALCIACGAEKAVAYKPCESCGYAPPDDTDVHLRSVYFSRARKAVGIPEDLLQAELAEASRQLQRGEEPQIDSGQLRRLRELGLDMQPEKAQLVRGVLQLLWHLLPQMIAKALPFAIIVGLIVILIRSLN